MSVATKKTELEAEILALKTQRDNALGVMEYEKAEVRIRMQVDSIDKELRRLRAELSQLNTLGGGRSLVTRPKRY